MSDLRKLMDHLRHIEKGGEFNRVRDLVTGRIVSKPVTEEVTAGAKKWPKTKAEIEAFQRANSPLKVDGLIGEKTLARLLQLGYVPPAGFKPVANKAAGSGADIVDEPDGSADPATPSSGQKPNGNNDQNTASNGSYNGSNIAPDDGPEDPKTWPSGVKKAPDFGYLDPQGMWIPTPFHIRTEDGKWRVPKNSPANLKGIQMGKYTPFQKKFHEMEKKVVYTDNSAIEQTKPVQLPGGALRYQDTNKLMLADSVQMPESPT